MGGVRGLWGEEVGVRWVLTVVVEGGVCQRPVVIHIGPLVCGGEGEGGEGEDSEEVGKGRHGGPGWGQCGEGRRGSR